MPTTQAERNFARAINEYIRAMEAFARSRVRYGAAVEALRLERGLPPFQAFGPLNRNYALERSVRNTAARTIQRSARTAATRRRVAFAGTSFSRGLTRNLVRTHILRNS